jgi:hypothetical protein
VIAPLLQQLPVLAVDGRTVFTSREVKAAVARSASGNVEVTLEVDDGQARVLQLAHQKGQVALPLRNPTDVTFYPVQPMIVKQGQLKPFGDPLDPKNPSRLMDTIKAVIDAPPKPAVQTNDPNAPSLLNPLVDMFRSMPRPSLEAPPTQAPPARPTVDVIMGSERKEVETKEEKDTPVEGGR